MLKTLNRNRVLLSGIGVAVLALTVVLFLFFSSRSQSEVTDSIALLPLQNLSGSPEQEYFADGMTEAIIGELQKIGSLGVSSRTSIMRYKNTGKLLPEIARELKVRVIAEGSVLREGNTVRINIKVIESSTEKQIWAKSFERNMQSILALQCEIALLMAHEIGVTVTPQEEMYLSSRAKVDPEAYDAYLKGRQYRFAETVESLPKALSYCQMAVEKDSNFAPGWSELSQAWIFLDWTIGVFPKYHTQSRMAVNKALALDSTLSETYVALAIVQIFYEFNWADGEKSLKHAIQLNRNDWNAHKEYGLLLLRTGRTAEAIVQFQKPQESDPLSGACMRELGLAYLLAGHHSLAIECLEKAVGKKSQLRWSMGDFYNSPRDHLVWEYLREDSVEKAKELCRLTNPDLEVFVDAIRTDRQHSAQIVSKLERLLDDPMTRSFYFARLYWQWGEHDKAIAQVEQGCRIQPAWTMVIPTDPYLKGIRSDPRFKVLLEKVGLHQ